MTLSLVSNMPSSNNSLISMRALHDNSSLLDALTTRTDALMQTTNSRLLGLAFVVISEGT